MSPASYRAAPPRGGDTRLHGAGAGPVTGSTGEGRGLSPGAPVTAPSHGFHALARLRTGTRAGTYSPNRGGTGWQRTPGRRDERVRRRPPARGDPPPRDLVLRRAARLAARGRGPGRRPRAVRRRRPPPLDVEGPRRAATARSPPPTAPGALSRRRRGLGRRAPGRRHATARAAGRDAEAGHQARPRDHAARPAGSASCRAPRAARSSPRRF